MTANRTFATFPFASSVKYRPDYVDPAAGLRQYLWINSPTSSRSAPMRTRGEFSGSSSMITRFPFRRAAETSASTLPPGLAYGTNNESASATTNAFRKRANPLSTLFCLSENGESSIRRPSAMAGLQAAGTLCACSLLPGQKITGTWRTSRVSRQVRSIGE